MRARYWVFSITLMLDSRSPIVIIVLSVTPREIWRRYNGIRVYTFSFISMSILSGYVLLCQPVLSIRICSSQNRISRNSRASFSFGLTYNSKNTAVTYLSDIRARRISSYHINLGENANQTKAINWNTQMCIIIWWAYILTMMFV